jgi:biotin carboxylase
LSYGTEPLWEIPHIVILHRYVGPIASYSEYIDHNAFRVSYVTTREASTVLDDSIATAITVVRMSGEMIATPDDIDVVAAAIQDLSDRFGAASRIIALYEGDLQMGADLRARFGIPGDLPDDIAPFRDKLRMHELLSTADVPTVPTVPVESPQSLSTFAEAQGWPLIVKPSNGTASSGITVLGGPDEVPRSLDQGLIAQPFINAPVLHVDGYFDGVELVTWTASAYVNTCLAYNDGASLGSNELDDHQALSKIEMIVREALTALNPRPMVFHAELLVPEGDYSSLLVLEIGARVGGAEIAYIWREIHGIDLVRIGFLVQLNEPIPASLLPESRPRGIPAVRAGWLLVPPSVERPCTVVSANSQARVRGLQAELLPALGAIMPAVGGYERTGARFRFAGQTADEVSAAIREVQRDFQFECQPASTVILVGSGGQQYREYSMRALAKRSRVYLLDTHEPTWQSEYITEFQHLDPDSLDAAVSTVRNLRQSAPGPIGIMTWDETKVAVTARLAEATGLPSMSAEAVENCRDKLTTRSLLAESTRGSVRYEVALTLEAVRHAAGRIGYPVVLKPRSMAGSVGVVLVEQPEAIDAAFVRTSAASYPGLGNLPGVLVEEYLEGPEISVDSVVRNGTATIANVARKRLGEPPYFEEVGHLVAPWREETWANDVGRLVQTVHEVLRVNEGITHAEIRLTPRGPRLIELNCRLGGDFIPLLGFLATGFDLVAAAADIALDRAVKVPEGRGRYAEVAFIYPDDDAIVESIELGRALEIPGVSAIHVLAEPGTTLLLPPRGVVPRVAAVLAVSESELECATALELAKAEIRVVTRPAMASAR